ncbi:HAD family hydrolase, partial [Candidatus Roizmanbacteria bacterium]|nr:HAD family hydrolase [Candidatus Roizmanbacteria bacterium]
MNKAIFIDKDGTLIEDIPFNVDTNKIKLMPYVEELKKLQDRGYLIIVISNQTGVAKDLFSENDLIPIKDKLALFLKE